jgi:hypothetical protein
VEEREEVRLLDQGLEGTAARRIERKQTLPLLDEALDSGRHRGLERAHRGSQRPRLRHRHAGRLSAARGEERDRTDQGEGPLGDLALRIDCLAREPLAADHAIQPHDGRFHERELQVELLVWGERRVEEAFFAALRTGS